MINKDNDGRTCNQYTEMLAQMLGNNITTTTGQIVDFKKDFPRFSRCFAKNLHSFGFLNSTNDDYLPTIDMQITVVG